MPRLPRKPRAQASTEQLPYLPVQKRCLIGACNADARNSFATQEALENHWVAVHGMVRPEPTPVVPVIPQPELFSRDDYAR